MRAIATVAQDVARMRGVPFSDLVSARRTLTIIQPRHEAMYLARALTTASLPLIGRHLGGRDHTTVLHGCRSIERRASTEPAYADELASMKSKIRDHLRRQVPGLIERDAGGPKTMEDLADAFRALGEREAAIERREEGLDRRERMLRKAEADAVATVAARPSPTCWLRAFHAFETARFGKGEDLAFRRLIEALTDFRTAFKAQGDLS